MSTVNVMLRAYTRYRFTVTADSHRRGTSQPSETRSATSPQISETDLGWCHYNCMSVCGYTGPGEAPRNVTAEAVSSTEISVQWNGLSTCRLVNGLIIKYRVQFTAKVTTETRDRELRDGEDFSSGGNILLTDSVPSPTTPLK